MLLPFSEEQLLQLAEYPKEALEHANREITKEMHTGKHIANPFGYFEAIVQSFLKKQATASQRASATSTVDKDIIIQRNHQQSERYYQFRSSREQKRFDILVSLGYDPSIMSSAQCVDILNRFRLSYYTNEDCRNPDAM